MFQIIQDLLCTYLCTAGRPSWNEENAVFLPSLFCTWIRSWKWPEEDVEYHKPWFVNDNFPDGNLSLEEASHSVEDKDKLVDESLTKLEKEVRVWITWKGSLFLLSSFESLYL